MTTVSAVMARSYTPDMFDDLELPPHTRDRDPVTRVTTLVFDADLTPEQAGAVWARMESIDDVDQARRAGLRAGRDALAGAEDPASLEEALALIAMLKAAVVDSLDYWLGEA